MKEYTDFIEFYNVSYSIVQRYNSLFKGLSSNKQIEYIRNNCPKEILNGFYIIGNISKNIADEISAKTTIVKFSTDSLIKNLIEHKELDILEYKNIALYLQNAQYILKKSNKNLIYFKINNQIYQFVIKATKNKEELFITTFHKASYKQLQKDIKRYAQIKR